MGISTADVIWRRCIQGFLVVGSLNISHTVTVSVREDITSKCAFFGENSVHCATEASAGRPHNDFHVAGASGGGGSDGGSNVGIVLPAVLAPIVVLLAGVTVVFLWKGRRKTPWQPTTGTEARDDAFSQPTTGTEARDDAFSQPTTGTEARVNAFSHPTTGTEARVNAFSHPTTGTETRVNAFSQPTTGTEARVDAFSQPTTGTETRVDAFSQPTTGTETRANAFSQPTIGPETLNANYGLQVDSTRLSPSAPSFYDIYPPPYTLYPSV